MTAPLKPQHMTSPRAISAYAMSLDDIMAEVLKSAHECGGCLVWTGATSFAKRGGKTGTPKFRNVSLRRLLYIKRSGKTLPAQRFVTATCETSLCIEHLAACTKAEAAVKGYDGAGVRMLKTVGNRRTAKALPWVKLSDEKADYIRTSDKNMIELAAELGVSKSLISKVRAGTSWSPSVLANPFGGLFAGLMRGAA